MSRIPPDSAENDANADDWRHVYSACEPGLRAFLNRRLGQKADVDDCLQVVYVKMVERGADVLPAARRAWLFRVAANESARMWRSKSTTDRVLEKKASNLDETTSDDASDKVIRNETTHKLLHAISDLPESTQHIIRLRMYDNLTFQEIADKLDIPLGTALTRMRRALERLRNQIEPDTE